MGAEETEAGRQDLNAELFEKYVIPDIKMVYKLCINYSSRPENVEENFNICLTNFYQYINSYDTSKSIKTWLHICTKRCVRAFDIKRDDDKYVDLEQASEIPSCTQDDMCTDVTPENYRDHMSDGVLWALDQLKPMYKRTLILQYCGYNLNEIMHITFNEGLLLKKNIETIKSRLFLARKSMKSMIDRDGKRRV